MPAVRCATAWGLNTIDRSLKSAMTMPLRCPQTAERTVSVEDRFLPQP